MGYEEPNKNLDEEMSLDTEIDLDEEIGFAEEEYGSGEETTKQPSKSKSRQNSVHALNARRAIEEHFERKKLRKELDYLFDEEFDEKANSEEE